MIKYLIGFSLIIFSIHISAQETDPWSVYITPSEVHQQLSKYVGDFEMEMTMWMNPGTEPMMVKVNSKHETILGGRFLEMTQSGNMMGMDYASVMTLGFNNTSKTFMLTTLTNMGTGILSLEGGWEKDKQIAVLKGQMTDPVNNGVINITQKITFIDDNTLLIENFDQSGDTPEQKSIQYKLIRK
mgnify:CR=1 FL=1